MKSPCSRWALLAILVMSANAANAGVYSDDMSRCLINNTSSNDKTSLVRWVFSVAALHPEVSRISAVTEQQREEIDREIAKLLERLLTETCRTQTQEALKYEGAIAMKTSFQTLGQVAMQELTKNQAVGNGFSGFTRYIDEAKLRALAPNSK